jgi:hypothetical protein
VNHLHVACDGDWYLKRFEISHLSSCSLRAPRNLQTAVQMFGIGTLEVELKESLRCDKAQAVFLKGIAF